jgi:prepilin-type N-terminal cleavage/methylation domain-containing protein
MFYKRHKKGFTLSEIVIAVALLGIILVVISLVFMKGLFAIKKGRYRATAFNIANSKFVELSNAGLSEPNGIPVADFPILIKGYTGCVDHGNTTSIPWPDSGGIDYEITGVEQFPGLDYNFDITVQSYGDNLKKIGVEVTWNQPDVGKQRIQLYTLLTREEI